MRELTFEAIVIGAGPGGYVCAIRLAQLGVKVALIEKGSLGGVCLNVGCIPSKAIIHAAKTAEKIGHAEEMGIKTNAPEIDMKSMQKWKGDIVKKLTGGVGQLCKANGVEVLRGRATFEDAHTVLVKSKKEGESRISFQHAVIATGSKPTEVPGFEFDGETIIDSTGALALESVPKSLLVVGGGYIGLELGTAYAKLGSKVTVAEMMDQVLPGFEKDIVQVIARKLKKSGITVHTSTKATGVEKTEGGATVTLETPDGEEKLEFEKVLVSVGRRPIVDGWGREALDLEMDGPFIKVNEQCRTSVPNIFAIGDVAGQPMLAHKASAEGEVAAEVIAGKKVAFDAQAIPSVVFTDPEIASTGLTEAQAEDAGYTVQVGKIAFAAIGRALSTNDTDGFAKVVADKETGLILGVHIVGNGASDLITEGTLAIEMGATAEDISLTVHPHPTLSESLMEAAKNVMGAAIHTVNRPSR